MDRTARALIAFARGPENVERRAAAMLLLAELELDDAAAVDVAREALASPTVLQEFALRYFEKRRPAGAVEALVPLLDAADTGFRARIRSLIVAYGVRAVPAVGDAAKGASRAWLAGAVEVLATIATGPALRALAEITSRGDGDLARTAADALHRTIRAAPEKDRPALLAHLLAAAERPEVAASVPARVVLCRACGSLELPEARKWLLAQAAKDREPVVRAAALGALVPCLHRDKLQAREVTALVGMLGEADFPHVVRPALDLLATHRFGVEAQALLLGLRESPHVAVRSFALAKLGESEAPGAVRALLGSLDDAEAVRRSAAGSLRKIPEARQALMKRFLETTDASAAFTMAETLAGYGLPWRRPTLDQLWQRYLDACEVDDRIQGAYLHFLREVAPDLLAESLRKRSATLMKNGRARDAARLRAIVRELPAATPEDGYQLALSLLKTRRRGMGMPVRRPDPALDLLVQLEEGAFPAATRLRKERSFDPEELYAVGFALAETHGAGRRMAEEILEHLAQRFPRTKVGKAAKNKLALAG